MDRTNAVEFKTEWRCEFYGQVTMKSNTKVFDRVRHRNKCSRLSRDRESEEKREIPTREKVSVNTRLLC